MVDYTEEVLGTAKNFLEMCGTKDQLLFVIFLAVVHNGGIDFGGTLGANESRLRGMERVMESVDNVELNLCFYYAIVVYYQLENVDMKLYPEIGIAIVCLLKLSKAGAI
ncbi:MAG: hypothetical protein SGILL_004106 [Bacillariaceae sp.]